MKDAVVRPSIFPELCDNWNWAFEILKAGPVEFVQFGSSMSMKKLQFPEIESYEVIERFPWIVPTDAEAARTDTKIAANVRRWFVRPKNPKI